MGVNPRTSNERVWIKIVNVGNSTCLSLYDKTKEDQMYRAKYKTRNQRVKHRIFGKEQLHSDMNSPIDVINVNETKNFN